MNSLNKKRKLNKESINKSIFLNFLENDLNINNKILLNNFINELIYNNLGFDNLIDILNNYDILKFQNNSDNNFIIWNYIGSRYNYFINEKIKKSIDKITKKLDNLGSKINNYFINNDEINFSIDQIINYKNNLFQLDNEYNILKIKFLKKINSFDSNYLNNSFYNYKNLLNKKEKKCLTKNIYLSRMVELNQSLINFNEELYNLIPLHITINKDIITKFKKKLIDISSEYKKISSKMNELVDEELSFNYKESLKLYNDIFDKYVEYRKNDNNMNYMHY
jgi:hypothetical protein